MTTTTKEVTLSDGSVVEQVFIESESGTVIMLKIDYDAQQEALANFVAPTLAEAVEEIAPVEEETI
jgi:hypothetical protein